MFNKSITIIDMSGYIKMHVSYECNLEFNNKPKVNGGPTPKKKKR